MRKCAALAAALLMLFPVFAARGESKDETIWTAQVRGRPGQNLLWALSAEGGIWYLTGGEEEQLIRYDPESGAREILDLDLQSGAAEEAEEGEEKERELDALFAWKGGLYALTHDLISSEDGSERLDGGQIWAIRTEEEEAVLTDSGLPRLDWTLMTEEAGGWTGSRPIRAAYALEDCLCIHSQTDEEEALCVFSLSDGRCRVWTPEGMLASTPGPENSVLVLREDGDRRTLSRLDPETGRTEDISSGASEGDEPLNLVYRNGTVYYSAAGRIWAAPEMNLARTEAVNDCPTGGENAAAEVIGDGRMLLWDENAIVLRTLVPGEAAEVRLLVRDYAGTEALDAAVYDLAAGKGDFSVSVDRTGSDEDLLQALVNRDGTADIFCLDLSSGTFEAAFARGFLAPLDESGILTARVAEMYPAVADAVRKEGSLLALPIQAWGTAPGLHPKVFRRLGYEESDWPETWDGFMRLLEELPGKLKDTEITVFPAQMTEEYVKRTLTRHILRACQPEEADAQIVFHTPEAERLLNRLAGLDWAALGVERGNAASGGNDYFRPSGSATLIELSTPVTLDTGAGGYLPLLLSLRGEEAMGSYSMTVACLNPFSAHRAEALTFLEALAERTDRISAYTFSPVGNEPVRPADFEATRKETEEALAQARVQADRARDAGMRSRWENTAEGLEKNLNRMLESWWEISPEAIAAYRERAGLLRPVKWDVQTLLLDSGDASIAEALDRFLQGRGSGGELLEALDRKVRMMRLEGN